LQSKMNYVGEAIAQTYFDITNSPPLAPRGGMVAGQQQQQQKPGSTGFGNRV